MLATRFSKLVGAAAVAMLATACAPDSDENSVRVFAAASLTDAFAELESEFEAQNPGIDVELNLAGSSSLREQIRAGAPADVFASANAEIMASLVDEGLVAGDATVFATNSLTVAVAPGNPGSVNGLEDLEREGVLVGLCVETAPCGELATRTLAEVGIEVGVDTREPDVRALLTKIELGELDAGAVYQTDVLAAEPGVESISFGLAMPLVTDYPLAVLDESPNVEAAQAFVDFVLSDPAGLILAELGFGAPR